jgi:hypothetical protein
MKKTTAYIEVAMFEIEKVGLSVLKTEEVASRGRPATGLQILIEEIRQTHLGADEDGK